MENFAKKKLSELLDLQQEVKKQNRQTAKRKKSRPNSRAETQLEQAMRASAANPPQRVSSQTDRHTLLAAMKR